MNLLVREEGQVGSGGQVGRESGTEYFFAGGGEDEHCCCATDGISVETGLVQH